MGLTNRQLSLAAKAVVSAGILAKQITKQHALTNQGHN